MRLKQILQPKALPQRLSALCTSILTTVTLIAFDNGIASASALKNHLVHQSRVTPGAKVFSVPVYEKDKRYLFVLEREVEPRANFQLIAVAEEPLEDLRVLLGHERLSADPLLS